MAASPRAVLLLAGLTSVAVGGCGAANDSGGPSTLPTLAASSLATTVPPITVSTFPTTSPPLTAPRGGPSTLAPAVSPTAPPVVAPTAPPAATSTSFPSGGPAHYADEPPTGALQIGVHGTRVQALQSQLVAMGYGINADGYFGRGTEAAVRAFQQTQGLPADGIASVDTQARLAQMVAGH